jgi:hypothetical protein
MPRWVNTGEDILPIPESKAQLPGLPEQASATAVAMRFFGLRKREQEGGEGEEHLVELPEKAAERAKAQHMAGLGGLGVIDTDLCLWAESLTPADQSALYLVPALPTVKMKTAVYPQPYGVMAPDTGQGLGFVCSINRWVADHPLLAGGALLAGAILLGGAGRRTARGRRKPRRAAA